LDAESQIEDLLYEEGIQPSVLCKKGNDEVDIEVVFPMDLEGEVAAAVSRRRKDISRISNSKWSLVIRTVLFHLAYEVFGALSTPPRVRMSTNVTNLRTPCKIKTQLPTSDGEAARDATALRYDVDLVLVSSAMPAGRTVFDDAAIAARDFNSVSRYLKIGALHGAYTTDRLIPSGERLAFWEISFQDDAEGAAPSGTA